MSDESYDGKQWIPDDALENLIMERSFHEGESPEKMSKRLLRENAPVVAQSLVHLAIHSISERTRLDAGRYIMDRILGRVGEELPIESETPLNQFVSEVMNDISNITARAKN